MAPSVATGNPDEIRFSPPKIAPNPARILLDCTKTTEASYTIGSPEYTMLSRAGPGSRTRAEEP